MLRILYVGEFVISRIDYKNELYYENNIMEIKFVIENNDNKIIQLNTEKLLTFFPAKSDLISLS